MKMQRIRDLREDHDLKTKQTLQTTYTLASVRTHIMRQTAGACRLKC